MNKKRKIDFVLYENNYKKTVFRFYPKRSSCHSFNDEPPKTWDDVYKVYYKYKILTLWKDDGKLTGEYCELFDSWCDECSIIDEIGRVCLLLADGVEVFKREDDEEIQLLNKMMLPFGMGTEWFITKRTCLEDIECTYYTFMLFNYSGKGFKFTLEDKNIKSFGEYLLGCCDYMLAHGDPI